MSKYTTQVRWIVEHYSQELERPTISQRIQTALPFIFNFSFPVWEPAYASTLEEKIIMHYYMREIAFETVELWRFFMNQRLNEIMPYYNELYKTTVREYDYLTDTYINEVIKRNRTDIGSSELTEASQSKGTNTSEGQTTNNLQHLSSDLPGATNAQEIGSDYYANIITKDTGNVGNNITGTNQGEGSRHTETGNKLEVGENVQTARWGNGGGRSQTQLLLEFRQSLLNVDMMIIDDLKDLFFTLY